MENKKEIISLQQKVRLDYLIEKRLLSYDVDEEMIELKFQDEETSKKFTMRIEGVLIDVETDNERNLRLEREEIEKKEQELMDLRKQIDEIKLDMINEMTVGELSNLILHWKAKKEHKLDF